MVRTLSTLVLALSTANSARAQSPGEAAVDSGAQRGLLGAHASGSASEGSTFEAWQSLEEANAWSRLGYVRGSALLVRPQEDARFLLGGAPIETDDDSFGMTFAVGAHLPQAPVSVEVEYAFRRFATEDYLDPDTGRLGDTDFYSHTLAFNTLLDVPDLVGPAGFYAGAGVGFRLSSLSFSSGGGGSTTEIEGGEFFWQLMGGATVSLSDRLQLYGGVRWTDAGDVEDEVIRLGLESVDVEVGVRFFF